MSSEELDVLLFGEKIGKLARTKRGARFQFDGSIAGQMCGSPLFSTALRVQAEPFDAARTFAWFSGLLPEDARLQEMQRFYGVADGDYLELLAHIGWECAGAAEIVPSADRELVRRSNRELSRLELDADALAKRLAALPSHPYDTAQALRVSLGGFQEKLCVVIDAVDMREAAEGHVRLQQAALPLDGAPSTHILKPQPAGRLPGMVEAEAWGMEVARHATDAASSALLDLEGAPLTLLVERFDRYRTSEGIVRIHQEDCAQALGIDPGRKYAATSTPTKSDPTYQAIAELFSNYAADPIGERIRLLRHLLVNVALGNTDAHAKNYALLHEGETIRLAPLYDVVPALELTPNMRFMGMRVDGRIRIDRVERQNLEAEARSWGLPARIVRATLDQTAEAIREGIKTADDLYPETAERHSAPALERLGKLNGCIPMNI